MRKVVIITGGASGIGRGILDRAVETGWSCAVFDLPGKPVEELSKAYPVETVLPVAVDITSEPEVKAATRHVADSLGRINGLVNCAGVGQNVEFRETTPEQFRRMLDVNVVGSFIVSRSALPHMDRGSIVNITSVSGIQGSVGRVAYGASKGAVNTMTRIMAVELAYENVRVNAIAPGPVETPMTEKWHDTKTRNDWVSRVPLGRYGSIREIATMTMVLLDDDLSSYVNGQVISVDGGFSIAGLMAKGS